MPRRASWSENSVPVGKNFAVLRSIAIDPITQGAFNFRMATKNVIQVSNLNKIYASGYQALKDVNLEIREGEIFALLGPNGAGKTTLISIICGIVNPTSGSIRANGLDIVKDYRKVRSQIGLVPQELTNDMFEKVTDTVSLSRGLFGKPSDLAHIEKTLKALSLWDKRDSKIMTLSGGMKRRVMIAKALSHEPNILFLDEPTAGVDVNLRRDMWAMVRELRKSGVTIILTTHYIEEAQEMADRIGVINKGEIVVVEEKSALMKKLGKKELTLTLVQPLEKIPEALKEFDLTLSLDGHDIKYVFDVRDSSKNGMAHLIKRFGEIGLDFKDLQTKESSLEDIFVNLVGERQ